MFLLEVFYLGNGKPWQADDGLGLFAKIQRQKSYVLLILKLVNLALRNLFEVPQYW